MMKEFNKMPTSSGRTRGAISFISLIALALVASTGTVVEALGVDITVLDTATLI